MSRSRYYLRSAVTLLRGFRHPLRILAIFLGLPFRAPVVISLHSGLAFAVRTAMDIWIIKEVCLDAEYERYGLQLQPSWAVVDIGGGLGEYAIYAARQCYRGHVYVFEPAPESFALLQGNISRNGIANVTALPLAIGAADGPLHLDVTSGVPVLYRTTSAPAALNEPAITVSGITLDQAFATLPIERCDMLKLDCEGAEYDILFATSASTFARIDRICLEYHNGATGPTERDLIDWLREQGYRVIHDRNPVHRHTGLLYASRFEFDE